MTLQPNRSWNAAWAALAFLIACLLPAPCQTDGRQAPAEARFLLAVSNDLRGEMAPCG